MADITWPTDGGHAFYPEAFDESVEFDVELTVSRGGRVTTRSLPGGRWLLTIAFPETTTPYLTERRKLEAFFLGLRGGADRLLMWNLLTPEPLGTMRGTVTLAASVAAGATTAQVTGGYASPNLLRHGSFEVDSNADGLADGWALFVGSGGDGARTYTKGLVTYSYNVKHGAYAQFISITAAGNAFDSGIVRTSKEPISASTAYTVSGWVSCSTAGKAYILARQYKADGVTQTGPDTVTSYAGTSMALLSAAFTSQADAAFVEVAIRGFNTVGEDLRIDAVQVAPGTVAEAYAGFPTLLRGDRVSIAGRRVMLTADATANDAGTTTVSFQPPLNAAASSGAAVTLIRPTTRYVLTTPVVVMPVRGNKLPGFAVEMVEE